MSVPAQAAGSWYVDLDGHWAADEIRVLWEEDVTDGYSRPDALGRPQTYFLPNAYMERAQFAVLLAKVMGLAPDTTGPPVYPDVPPGYRAGGDLDAYPWVQAGARAGLFPDEPGRPFRPGDVVRRDEAVAMLVHALELTWYADRMPESRIEALLGAYRDADRIRPALRRAVAAAVDLAIVVGYGDGFLRPDRSLTRAEGATLIYKSALLRVGAEPPSFSPDGDHVQDRTRLGARALLNRNQTGWEVQVLTPDGQPVRTWSGQRLPASWDWDGRDEGGRPVPAGLYLLRGELVARQGTRFTSAVEPLEVVYHRLVATASPAVVEAGEPVHIQALTEGPVVRVVVHLPGDTAPTPMARTAPGTWEAGWTVPEDTEPGSQALVVVAAFPETVRRETVYVDVLPPLWIQGAVAPNPARPGEPVTVTATVPATTDVVTLHPPNQPSIPLREVGDGRWTARWQVPPDAAPGSSLPLELEARRRDRRAVAHLDLAVAEGAANREPVFHLTH